MEDKIFIPGPNKIFVFGSNMAGIHGKGSAKDALKYGAILGIGFGKQGNSYAIPTKSGDLKRSLGLETISSFVDSFKEYAEIHGELEFFVTRIGCGLAGYRDEDIMPMFRDAPKNCELPTEWDYYRITSNIQEASKYFEIAYQAICRLELPQFQETLNKAVKAHSKLNVIRNYLLEDIKNG